MAAGNANGDIPMLQFSGNQSSPTLGLLVRHDDARREYAYATGAERALEMSSTEGWRVVSMRRDWSQVFSHE